MSEGIAIAITAAITMAACFSIAGAVLAGIRLIKFSSKLIRELEAAGKSASSLVGQLESIESILGQIQQELSFMRQVTSAKEDAGVFKIQDYPGVAANKSYIPFPAPNLGRYAQVPLEHPDTPEATVSDTDIDLLNQTDAELAEEEVLERLRDRGIEIPDRDNPPPGIVAESN